MHPEVVSDHPGMCPECGMALVPTGSKKDKKESHGSHACCTDDLEKMMTNKSQVGHTDHEVGATGSDKHAGHKKSSFLIKFWIALVLTIPVVAYSGILKTLFSWQAPAFTGSQYLPLLFGSVIFWYCGWIFLASAWRELRGSAPGMMTLIAIAVIAAYSFSVGSILLGGTETLFWELSTLITIMLLGHYLEMKAVQGAQSALRELAKLLPDTAEVLRGEKTMSIPLSEVRVGDLVVIRPGGRMPTDGLVTKGASHVDESMMTGESKPVAKKEGDGVVAGTINGDGSLTVKVTQIGEKTFLSGVMQLVAQAQASKSRVQLLADRAAFYLTIVALIVGGITVTAWLAVGAGPATAIERLVAVLVIACPHALGLAIPLVASISTTKAARNGFLIRERRALEAARTIDTVVFDKTGTLTTGTYGVTDVFPVGKTTPNEVLALAASVDTHSEHFIAKAIVSAARQRNVVIPQAADFVRLAGKGVRGRVNGQLTYAGGEAILDEMSIVLPEELKKIHSGEGVRGKTVVFVVVEKTLVGMIALADVIRQESREAVAALKAAGITPIMITGDSQEVASWVAKDLGIDEFFARVLPDKKAERVKELQSRGKKVAMVGDGINDAPALTQADLGIAIGAGTNVAIESAGIILVRNDPRDILRIVNLSRRTYQKMIQNLWWAAGYNIVAMPLAAGVLAAWGILLQPALAALLMSVSTLIVAANAVLLKNAKI